MAPRRPQYGALRLQRATRLPLLQLPPRRARLRLLQRRLGVERGAWAPGGAAFLVAPPPPDCSSPPTPPPPHPFSSLGLRPAARGGSACTAVQRYCGSSPGGGIAPRTVLSNAGAKKEQYRPRPRTAPAAAVRGPRLAAPHPGYWAPQRCALYMVRVSAAVAVPFATRHVPGLTLSAEGGRGWRLAGRGCLGQAADLAAIRVFREPCGVLEHLVLYPNVVIVQVLGVIAFCSSECSRPRGYPLLCPAARLWERIRAVAVNVGCAVTVSTPSPPSRTRAHRAS